MIPIHQLLARIRWDAEFGQGEFVLAYLDHLQSELVRVPLQKVHFNPHDHFSVEVEDTEGNRHAIPYHRIREVRKNGQLIWQRPAHPGR